MDVLIVETSGLGDRSYLISAGDVAVVIYPQRDIDRLLTAAADRGVRVTHVLETHIHNDYVSGGLELARVTGAEYVVPAGEDVGYERRPIGDGDIVDAGPIQLRAMHTPGHTHHHTSYVLSDFRSAIMGVFSGGSLLHGSAGRTDLLGDEHTEELTHAQYHSVRRLVDELPSDAEVYPTHGFGSFCAATPADGDSSTIGRQRETNPALTQDEETYVAELLAGLTEYPAYYAHMGVINRSGPDPVDLSSPKQVEAKELRHRIESGEWIVDLSNRTAFAAGHLEGTVGFELSDSFVTYFGWLYRWDAPLTLIGESDDDISAAQRELVRIGIDNVTGAATEPVEELATESGLRSYRVADFAALAEVIDRRDTVVVDVRQPDEYDSSHVRGALNIPVHEITDRADELPAGDVWVHCASGYRASVAASLLDRNGRVVVLIDDTFDNAEPLTTRRCCSSPITMHPTLVHRGKSLEHGVCPTEGDKHMIGMSGEGSRRTVDIALGILVGLRGCSDQEAFAELVGVVNRTGVGIFSVAASLVAIAAGSSSADDSEAFNAWGELIRRARPAPLVALNGALVRPHDIRVGRNSELLLPAGTDGTRVSDVVAATIDRIAILGFEVRLELTDPNGAPFIAQITRGDAEALGLKRGDSVYVRATRISALPGGTELPPDDAADDVGALISV